MDISAQIGGATSEYECVHGPYASDRRTKNGDCFIYVCSMNSLKIDFSIFQHKDIHKIICSDDHLAFTKLTIRLRKRRKTTTLPNRFSVTKVNTPEVREIPHLYTEQHAEFMPGLIDCLDKLKETCE